MEIIKLKETKNILYFNEIEENFKKIISKNPLTVAIDFIEINRIDSLLIGTFVKYFNISEKLGINLIFLNINSSIEKIIVQCGLHKHFTIIKKEDFEKLKQYN